MSVSAGGDTTGTEPALPRIVTLSCQCGAVIQRDQDNRRQGDELCYLCKPGGAEERARQRAALAEQDRRRGLGSAR